MNRFTVSELKGINFERMIGDIHYRSARTVIDISGGKTVNLLDNFSSLHWILGHLE
jgi:hypothetical protein